MQEKHLSGRIRKFLEEYECLKRVHGEPCRMNGSELLKIIKKNNFEDILKQMRDDEDNHQKFARTEATIISVFTLKDFFNRLLPELKRAFQIPYIWLTFIDDTPIARLARQALQTDTLSEIPAREIAFIKNEDFDGIFKNGPKPVITGRYTGPYSLVFPEGHNFSVRSMAIIPLYIDGTVAGCVNFGHFVSSRFEPSMDSGHVDLIRQLTLKISLSLSRVAAHETLSYLDRYDFLTGLLNRKSFDTELQREFGRSLRHENDLSIAFLDLDGFKGLNDLYGHEYGDMAVKYVADTIQRLSRAEDTAARFAGDEFVLMLPESKSDVSGVMIRRIQDYLDENPFEYGDTRFCLRLNWGIASLDENHVETPKDLIKSAYNRLNDTKVKSGQDVADGRASTARILKIHAS